MRGPKPAWAQIGDLRVVDGDDVLWRGAQYRMRYDAPETHNFRSKHDRALEWTRGVKAMHRLAVLIGGARSVCVVPMGGVIHGRGGKVRYEATLIIDGRDVAQIALREGWGCPAADRQDTDWGRWETPFPDHLPMPEGMEEYTGEDDDD